jgi:hypothetical protein
MSEPDQKEFDKIQKTFFANFIAGLIFFFFWFYFSATIGGVKFLQPIVLNPFLLLFSVITSSFGYATLLWDREMRKFQRRL